MPAKPDGMLARVALMGSSPVLVGRASELAAFDDAFAAVLTGTVRTLVVGGEAGVGKTRFVTECCARARAHGARLLVGWCLELSREGIPFAPFTAALRTALREVGEQAVAAAVGGDTAELAPLLPELGRPATDSGAARGRLFEHVLLLLESLAEERPLVLVLEDAHWADRSSRELLLFLLRNLGGRIQIVVTYRSDELHRNHPLRPLLAELTRLPGVERHELPRLSRPEVGEQVTGILGRAPDPQFVGELYERSEGNPLFVESLVCCGVGGPLSDSLRDLLLRQVEVLPASSVAVLRTASAAGLRVEHRLLAAVAALPEAALAEALRPAVDGNVLLADSEGYTFRHALIREAVHDDLLPGEHTRLHSRFAETLDADRSLLPAGRVNAEIAHHRWSAHDAAGALSAYWAAAADARNASAFAEELRLLERVLGLWDQVPDAVERLGADHVGLVEAAARAAWNSGDGGRGMPLVTAELAAMDAAADAGRAAMLLVLRARLRRLSGQGGILDDLQEAERLAGESRGTARAEVANELARVHMLEPRPALATAYAEEALALARTLGLPHVEADALCTLASLAHIDGNVGRSVELFEQARLLAEAAHEEKVQVRVCVNQSDALESLGQHEQAAAVARRGGQLARVLGLTRSSGVLCDGNLAESLYSLGQWDETLALLDEADRIGPPAAYQAQFLWLRGSIALRRGDVRQAAAQLVRATALRPQHITTDQEQALVRLKIEVAAAEGEPESALEQVMAALSAERIARTARLAWPLLLLGVRACADLAAWAAAIRHDGPLALVTTSMDRLDEAAASLGTPGGALEAARLTYLAERCRIDGPAGAAAWDEVAAARQGLQEPYERAYALVRAAEALARTGDRAGATHRLREAAEIATRLGAALRSQIDQLATRARIPLMELVPGESAGPDGAQRLGLTPREVEVLRLVAAGRSNRLIAQELFISPKTASVHVSNILTKLGVTGRGEAAAVAYRLRLFEAADQR